jgi:hypothetical protein
MSSDMLWILDDDGRPVCARSTIEWGLWFGRPGTQQARIVGRTTVGPLVVSTVFLGLDHGWLREGPPIVFETMIFGGTDEYCERYATRAQAEAGHAEAVRLAELYARASSLAP